MRHPVLAAMTAATAVGLVLTACSSAPEKDQASAIIVGTTDKVTALDPAGSWDLGSVSLQNQVFSWLLTSAPGSPEPVPDLATSAKFTSPTQYTVVLRDGLTFANGHPLTASDVKFSFDRQIAIAAPNGPSSLLSDLASTEVKAKDTVVFTLKSPNNAVWPQILTSPAGAIVDEEVFSAHAVTSNDDIVAGKAFAGQYIIKSFSLNSLAQLTKNELYSGLLGPAKNSSVIVKYYADETNLKLDLTQGEVQVAYRTLNATSVESLRTEKGLKVHTGSGAEARFIVFNPASMPFGSATAEPNPTKALAVRTAAAHLIDRKGLATRAYKDTYLPLYSVVPTAFPGSVPSYKSLYGDGEGGPSADKARATLEEAGVSTPVVVNLQYNKDHYGATSEEEYGLIKTQLESSGLFKVNLQSTEWSEYIKARSGYPVYQFGWFMDYPDPDSYLNMLYGTTESPSILGAAATNEKLNSYVLQERTLPTGTERNSAIGEAQAVAARDLIVLPLLGGTETVVAADDVAGVDDSLDGTGRFRFGLLNVK